MISRTSLLGPAFIRPRKLTTLLTRLGSVTGRELDRLGVVQHALDVAERRGRRGVRVDARHLGAHPTDGLLRIARMSGSLPVAPGTDRCIQPSPATAAHPSVGAARSSGYRGPNASHLLVPAASRSGQLLQHRRQILETSEACCLGSSRYNTARCWAGRRSRTSMVRAAVEPRGFRRRWPGRRRSARRMTYHQVPGVAASPQSTIALDSVRRETIIASVRTPGADFAMFTGGLSPRSASGPARGRRLTASLGVPRHVVGIGAPGSVQDKPSHRVQTGPAAARYKPRPSQRSVDGWSGH